MDQIIIEHYKNSRNFLSLKNFKIPFIVDIGLYFNKEKVYKNELEEGILINKKLNASNSQIAIEGVWIYYDENGNKNSEGNYKNGKQEGFWISWDENSIKESEGNYKNGRIDGFWIYWYPNGQLNANNNHVAIKHSEKNYKNGKKDGLWIYWYENGNKKSERNWKNGKEELYIY